MKIRLRLIASLLLALSVAVPVSSSDGDPSSAGLSAERVRQQVAMLEGDTAQSEAVRSSALQLLRDALANLERIESNAAARERLEVARTAVPQRAVEFERRLLELPPLLKPIGKDVPLESVKERLASEDASLAETRQLLIEARADQAERARRRRQIPEELRLAREKLNAAPLTVANDDPKTVTDARRVLHQARVAAARSDIDLLETELRSYEARERLLSSRLQVYEAEERIAQQHVDMLSSVVGEIRQVDARETVRSASEVLRDLVESPQVRRIAEENLALAARRVGPRGTAARIEALSRRTASERRALEELRAERTRIERRVEITGVDRAIGRMLRESRGGLRKVKALEADIAGWQTAIVETQLDLLDFRDQQQGRDPEQALTELLDGLALSADERSSQTGRLRSLLESRRSIVAALVSDTLALYEALTNLESIGRARLQETRAFRSFIERNVVWSQSHPALGTVDSGASLVEDAAWLLSPATWRSAAAVLAEDIKGSMPLWLTVLILGLLSRSLARRFDGRLQEFAALLDEQPTAMFRTALSVTRWTVFASAGSPLVLWFVGFRLQRVTTDSALTPGLASGLQVLGGALFVLGLLRRLTVPNGLAMTYLRWPADRLREGLAVVRSWRRWAVPLLTGIALVDGLGSHDQFAPRLGLVAQLGFAAFLVGTTRAVWKALVQMGYQPAPDPDSSSEVAGGRVWWMVAVSIVPGLLGLASVAGYHLTATFLAARLAASLLLVATVVCGEALTQLWFSTARQRLAVERARKRKLEGASATAAPSGIQDSTVSVPSREMQLHEVRAQSRSVARWLSGVLLASGLYAIWASALPALTALEEIAVWGDPVDQGGDGVVTLAALLMATVMFVLTSIAARNAPGLIEVFVLKYLPIDGATRYAVRQVLRYALTVIGLVIAVKLLGLRWESVQWLIAAMTVGLGFGLQEIFANFVSGMIILFERPMRIGDVVTIGSVSGTVTDIRIRATTITDWDRKELVVPNKEFITGQLVNWTLSDDIVRLCIPVGVAYGTDTIKARALMKEVAQEISIIRKEPPPVAVFLAFGDSSLNLELRAFVNGRFDLLAARDKLHEQIDLRFQEAGIEIAFPQRDLHVRSMPSALVASVTRALPPSSPADDTAAE